MTYSAAAVAAFDLACSSVNASALAGGDLDFLDAGGVVLATADLGTPTSSGNVTTMGGYPRTVAGTPGTIASARYRTGAGGNWKTGISVGLFGSGAQVIVSSLTIAVGQSVTIDSATLTHSGTAV